MPIDIWEMNLKSEGYLFPDEDLLEVLKDEKNLHRKTLDTIGGEESEDTNFGLVPQDFDEADFADLEGTEQVADDLVVSVPF